MPEYINSDHMTYLYNNGEYAIFAVQEDAERIYVDLVRCEDCKYNNGGRCSYHGGAGYKWVVDNEDYCSCGERIKE